MANIYELQQKLKELEAKVCDEAFYIDVRPYSHNLVAIYLKQIKELTDTEYVEEVIVNNQLHKRGWYVSDEAWVKSGEERFTPEQVEEFNTNFVNEIKYMLDNPCEDSDEESDEMPH